MRGSLDLSKKIEFAIIEVVDDSAREVHTGSVRFSGDLLVVIHEEQSPDDLECCVSQKGNAWILVTQARNVERVQAFESLASLKQAIAEGGLVFDERKEDARPEVA